jgi:hypothetical protein
MIFTRAERALKKACFRKHILRKPGLPPLGLWRTGARRRQRFRYYLHAPVKPYRKKFLSHSPGAEGCPTPPSCESVRWSAGCSHVPAAQL